MTRAYPGNRQHHSAGANVGIATITIIYVGAIWAITGGIAAIVYAIPAPFCLIDGSVDLAGR
ncbi:MAG: hypothetical protein JO023_07000 [Chloroflexi bacterium]|nr:hypothetical protein [Chloroflexota bacterium]